MTIEIPNKSSFTFGEVSSITEIKPYVLRFWESEFNQIDPIISESGQKIYDQADLHSVLKIKNLLFDEKLSIPKAKYQLMEETVGPMAEIVLKPTYETNIIENVSEEIQVMEENKKPWQELNTILLAAKDRIKQIKSQNNW
jgi:DNA-binding transcriptional MerR regulator